MILCKDSFSYQGPFLSCFRRLNSVNSSKLILVDVQNAAVSSLLLYRNCSLYFVSAFPFWDRIEQVEKKNKKKIVMMSIGNRHIVYRFRSWNLYI